MNKFDFFSWGSVDGLNKFSSVNIKMKKLFPHKKRSSHIPPNIEHPHSLISDGTGHTLDRIVNAKEEARKKWTEEQEGFRRRQRDYEMQMINMEEAEVTRREEEVRKRNDELDDKRRKNRMVQEAVAAQIRTLQDKLDEYKLNHKAEEESMEDEISALEDTLTDVKITLEKRKASLAQEKDRPSAPPDTSSMYVDSSMYPTLPSHNLDQSRSEPKLSYYQHQHSQNSNSNVPVPSARSRNNFNSSSGSSPQSSHASSSIGGGGGGGTSRSVTPKTDSSSEFDTTV